MTRARILVVLSATAIFLAAFSAHAEAGKRKIFLNGIDLADVEVGSAEFASCKVVFDKNGDIHISAPGFDIKATPKGRKVTPARNDAKPVAVTARYWLIARETRPGASGYVVTVYANGRKVKTVRSGKNSEATLEISKYLHKGWNNIRIVATKLRPTGGRTSVGSASDAFSVMIGAGTETKDTLIIKKTLMKYKRTAAETKAFVNNFRIEGR